jgi:uncharacterized RDD family membrane protein YckC
VRPEDPPLPPPWRATDIGHLEPVQRSVLGEALDEAEIPWDVVAGELRTPAADAELVDLLVDRASAASGDREHDVAVFADVAVAVAGAVEGHPSGVPAGPVIASGGRRLVAYLVESVALGLLVALVRSAAGTTGPQLAYLVTVVDAVVLVAVAGGTAGMLVFGMRVVRAGEDPAALPGWRTAIVRYVAVVWPFLLATAIGLAGGDANADWLSTLATVWTLACFAPILFDPMRRGLHDRVAGTLVLDVREPHPPRERRPSPA